MLALALVAVPACSSSSGGGGGTKDGGASDDGGGGATCKIDAECANGETCDTASGTCLYTGCKSDADCQPGETCDTATGACTGAPTTVISCQQCACINLLSMGGCANLCDSAQNGNPGSPNFCNMHAALPQCAKCLIDNCGLTTAGTADPTSCNM
jgi:hypothetical protein